MENTMRNLLMSFCGGNSCWKYSVFWKLNQQSSMMLTWEDGYCDSSKLGEPVESLSDDCFSTNTNTTLFCESEQESVSSECPIALAMADMSIFHYAIGEGAVGKVAYRGDHCWFFSDDIRAGESKSKIVSEFPDEWIIQVLEGIKTILLVPVSPHGVFQLGSLEKVPEDLASVTFIKDSFSTFQHDFSVPFTPRFNLVFRTSSQPMENFDDDSLSIIKSTPNRVQCEDLKPVVVNVKIPNSSFSTINAVNPQITTQNGFQGSVKDDLWGIFKGKCKNVIDASCVDSVKNEEYKMSCPIEESESVLQHNDFNVELQNEISDGILQSQCDADMIEHFYENNNVIDADYANMSRFLSFPIESELHKVIGPAFHIWENANMWDSSFIGEGSCSTSNLIFNDDITDSVGLSAWEFSELASKDDAANLLDALVPSLYNGLDDTSAERSDFLVSQNQFKNTASLGCDSVPWTHVTPTYVSSGTDKFNKSSATTNSSFKSSMIHLQNNGQDSVHTRKGAILSKVSKRRSRPGENHKPRPRDRQMIQDRVKELRELVPNGAKCSIDGLLERTIKHMLFLRSVSDRAEKFSQWTHQEADGSKNSKSSEIKDTSQNGTSRAFQLGSELEACPIVVEDLEYPGHILIEMICNKHSIFLEIAQVIRGLELTILEGNIKSRSSTTWARFIVEVSSGFHRMDIFWPLMHLLRRNQQPISSKI